MKRSIPVLFLLFSLLAPGPARADRTVERDRNDTPGLLDIRLASAGHVKMGPGRFHLAHRITMYEAWPNEALAIGGESWGSITIYLNTDEDSSSERVIWIRAEPDGTLVTQMSAEQGRRGHAKVRRPDEKSVTVIFAKRFLGRGLTGYGFRVWTEYAHPDEPQCPGEQSDVFVACDDFAPLHGYHRHRGI
jgi:hypothetical protein